MNVNHKTFGIGRVLDEAMFVLVLEEVPNVAIAAVEVVGVGGAQAGHEKSERNAAGMERKVHMVEHQGSRETTPPLSLKSLLPVLVGVLALALPAQGATPGEARTRAIGWLESHQNSDGSLGSTGSVETASAEGLLGLATSGGSGSIAGQRLRGWLLATEPSGSDPRARRIRALDSAGVGVSDRATTLVGEAAVDGWGVVSGAKSNSYDTSLALGALHEAGMAVPDLAAKKAFVLAQLRSDGGFGGDGVPVGTDAPSDPTLTAEILRALAGTMTAAEVAPPLALIGSGGAPLTNATDTLEVAARLAAVHAYGLSDAGLTAQLLSSHRFTLAGSAYPGVWSETDALMNVMGLLAVATTPGGVPSSCVDDYDCDGVLDADDAFPHDSSESADLDGDGVGDAADPDIDGDGVPNGSDWDDTDPTEWADADNDGFGDNVDLDDDNDGLFDLDEIERGTDPLSADTDADAACDGPLIVATVCATPDDPCPLAPLALDQDGDGYCSDVDACDDDPLEILDFDGDGLCDGRDPDDDDDNFSDAIELAAGSNPFDAASFPGPLSFNDPNGDADADGLTNLEEESTYLTSPFLADTDQDGATDLAEAQGGTALDPATNPGLVVGVMSSSTAAEGINFMPAESTPNPAIMIATSTGGQATPVARDGGEADETPAGYDGSGVLVFQHQPGFQAQTLVGKDADGDGLDGFAEAGQRTSGFSVDTDGDGFVDGTDGVVSVASYPGGGNATDLDGGGFVDGEGFGDPADASIHPGMPGDVAPLGAPDGRVNAGDAAVALQISADPGLPASQLSGARQAIAEGAADADEDGDIDAADALRVLHEATGNNP